MQDDHTQAALGRHEPSPLSSAGAVGALLALVAKRDELERAKLESLARRLVAGLEARGVDGDSLLRLGMAPFITAPVAMAVLVAGVLAEEDLHFDTDVDTEGWLRALNAPSATELREEPDWLARLPDRLQAWANSAPLGDLLTLTPPGEGMVAALPLPSPEQTKLATQYLWLVLRTTEQPFDAWGTEELHLEYRWLQGDLEAVAPAEFMGTDHGNIDLLCREISRRAVYDPIDEAETRRTRMLTKMQAQARSFLDQRRFDAAAALFEYLLAEKADDLHAANNLGFCLIPVDPARAREAFIRAEEAGYRPQALVLYNRLCVAVDDIERGELLLAAERYFESALESEPGSGVLWRRSGGDWETFDTDDFRRELASLALATAVELGRFDRTAAWHKRLNDLPGPSDD